MKNKKNEYALSENEAIRLGEKIKNWDYYTKYEYRGSFKNIRISISGDQPYLYGERIWEIHVDGDNGIEIAYYWSKKAGAGKIFEKAKRVHLSRERKSYRLATIQARKMLKSPTNRVNEKMAGKDNKAIMYLWESEDGRLYDELYQGDERIGGSHENEGNSYGTLENAKKFHEMYGVKVVLGKPPKKQ